MDLQRRRPSRNFTFYTQLRYRLLPFRYSNAQAAYHETPVQCPVRFVDGTQDEILVGHGDSELLVAPIHVEHATSREVKFPAGDNPWINYWTDQQLDPDTTTATADAPLDRVPLFVKAGSIIPMGPAMQYVDEKIADPVTLDIYPYADSAYTLYEDDGKTTDYQLGKFSRTPISCGSSPAGCGIDIGPNPPVSTSANPQNAPTSSRSTRSHTFIVYRHDRKEFAQQNSREAFDAAAEGSFSDGKVIWVKLETPTGQTRFHHHHPHELVFPATIHTAAASTPRVHFCAEHTWKSTSTRHPNRHYGQPPRNPGWR